MLFKEIWEKASELDVWRQADLVLSCKATQIFIENNFNLSDKPTANLVRAISYEWK